MTAPASGGPARRHVFLCLFLFSWLAACSPSAPEPNGSEAPPPRPQAPFLTVTPQPVPIEETLPGRITAIRSAEIRPQVAGLITERLFEEGTDVEQGQVLYRIDPSLYRAGLASAQSQRSRGQAALVHARSEAERIRRLAERGLASARDVEAAEASLQLASAEVAQANAAITRSRLDLGYAEVTAPISGRIGISRVNEGALVGAYEAQPLAVIQQLDEVYADVRQPLWRYEEIRDALRSGQLQPPERSGATLLSPRGTPYTTDAELLFTDTQVNPSTGEVTLRLRVPNEDRHLLPGMFIRARVPFGVAREALLIPQEAVRHDAITGAHVYVINEQDSIEARPVRTGTVIEGSYLIEEGLSGGERVLLRNHDNARPGTAVEPIAETSVEATTAPHDRAPAVEPPAQEDAAPSQAE